MKIEAMTTGAILVTILFLHTGMVWADVTGRYSDRYNEDFRYVQTLSWEALPDVRHYAVVVEENTATGWIERVNETTGRPELQVYLKSGGYRFSVTAFDYLDRAGEPSSWVSFTVLPALAPAIRSVEPSKVSLGEESGFAAKRAKRTISMSGENLLNDSEIVIVPAHGASEADAIPVDFSVDSQKQTVNISFDFSSLPPDRYDIVVKNPGGLQATWRNFEVLPVPVYSGGDSGDRPKTFFFHEGYAPLIPLSGTLNAFLGEYFYPVGAAVKLSLLPFTTLGLKWGFETEASWAYLAGSQGDYILSGNMINIPVCLIIQKRLWKEQLWFSVRGGGGLTFVQNFAVQSSVRDGTASVNTWIPLVTAGVAITVHIGRGVFLDIGADYLNIFSSDDLNTAYIRPMIGFGGTF
jgi:hypothetical protein